MTEPTDHIEVPPERLSAEALLGVIDAFIAREGTDYGHGEYSLEDKRRDVRRQLDAGKVRIVFDPKSETVNLIRTDLPVP
ncbi:MAG: YheU family protein [Myxococcota bacterium]